MYSSAFEIISVCFVYFEMFCILSKYLFHRSSGPDNFLCVATQWYNSIILARGRLTKFTESHIIIYFNLLMYFEFWEKLKARIGCVSLGWSGSRLVIRDHPDHFAENEPMNLSQIGLIGFYDVSWSQWSWITHPDPDPPKVTHFLTASIAWEWFPYVTADIFFYHCRSRPAGQTTVLSRRNSSG